MMRARSLSRTGLAAVASLCLTGAALAEPPKGWIAAGTNPSDYEMGVDRMTLFEGKPSAFLRSKKKVEEGFGTMMQLVEPRQYAGKRVRFSAAVKSRDVESWAGLWMRIDGRAREVLAFDNMQSRPIKGTTDWKRYDVVLDVDKNASGIAFGILLGETGVVWLSGVRFEVVDRSVPVTDTGIDGSYGETPKNLDFTQ
jgi:hypothetical protein